MAQSWTPIYKLRIMADSAKRAIIRSERNEASEIVFKGADKLTIWPMGVSMTVTSMDRIALSSLALVAAGVATVFFGIPHIWREQPIETKAATAAPAVVAHASSVGDEGSAAPRTAPAPAAPSPSPARGEGTKPVFDVAVIGRAGDAVIAGTGAPGATLELLRNGDLQDRVVADQSGQFVMTPSQLPRGTIS